MKKDKKLTSSEKIAARTESFFAKNARLLAIIGIIIVVLCVVIAVVSITSNSSRDKIATATYELEQDYYNLLVMDETSDEYNTAASEFIASADAIISEAKTGDYASLKAKYLLGLYYYDAEDWANALSYFEQVVNEGGCCKRRECRRHRYRSLILQQSMGYICCRSSGKPEGSLQLCTYL